jgi:hypothetical protein
VERLITLRVEIWLFFAKFGAEMQKRFIQTIAISFLTLFVGATISSCAAKKNCHPPCPTWQKKKPRR